MTESAVDHNEKTKDCKGFSCFVCSVLVRLTYQTGRYDGDIITQRHSASGALLSNNNNTNDVEGFLKRGKRLICISYGVESTIEQRMDFTATKKHLNMHMA